MCLRLSFLISLLFNNLFIGCTEDLNLDENGCHDGDYTISTKAEMIEFQPYRCITGNLTISSEELNRLDLPNLETVTGDLIISNNQLLTSLEGIPKLSAIKYSCVIPDDAECETCRGGSLIVTGNARLESLTGLENITAMKAGNLDIRDNPKLTSLSGLSNLTAIAVASTGCYEGVDLHGGKMIIQNNETLTNLNGLESLAHVDYAIAIDSNSALTDIEALSSIQRTNRLDITDNPVLTSLKGLSNLTIESLTEPYTGYLDELNIINNDALVNLDGLQSIISVATVEIADNGALISLEGLSSHTSIYWSLAITDNLLPQCSACEFAEAIDLEPDYVTVQNNQADACGSAGCNGVPAL